MFFDPAGKHVQVALSWKDKVIARLRAELSLSQRGEKRLLPEEIFLRDVKSNFQAADAARAEKVTYDEELSLTSIVGSEPNDTGANDVQSEDQI